jgi:hypothetical protein
VDVRCSGQWELPCCGGVWRWFARIGCLVNRTHFDARASMPPLSTASLLLLQYTGVRAWQLRSTSYRRRPSVSKGKAKLSTADLVQVWGRGLVGAPERMFERQLPPSRRLTSECRAQSLIGLGRRRRALQTLCIGTCSSSSLFSGLYAN